MLLREPPVLAGQAHNCAQLGAPLALWVLIAVVALALTPGRVSALSEIVDRAPNSRVHLWHIDRSRRGAQNITPASRSRWPQRLRLISAARSRNPPIERCRPGQTLPGLAAPSSSE